MKNALESTGNRADHMEERISELKDRNLEITPVEEEKVDPPGHLPGGDTAGRQGY